MSVPIRVKGGSPVTQSEIKVFDVPPVSRAVLLEVIATWLEAMGNRFTATASVRMTTECRGTEVNITTGPHTLTITEVRNENYWIDEEAASNG